MKIPKSRFNERFYPLLNCRSRYMVLYGGRGSSKSEFTAQYCILRCMLNEYFKCVYSRKVSTNIRDTQFSLLKKWIVSFGLQQFFKVSETTMRIDCTVTGNCLIARGVDDPEKTKSIDEPSHVWFEEITEFNQEDFEVLNNSLRTQKTHVQSIMTFNPIDENNWVRKFFFDENDNTKPHPRFGNDIVIHHSTYIDNHFIDRDSYYNTLVISCAGDQNRLRINVEGIWGVADKQRKFAYAFDSKLHVRKTIHDNAYITWLSFDFNVNPISCTAFQWYDNSLKAIHSFKLDNSDIYQLCNHIRARFPGAIFKVTGDATGQSRSAMTREGVNYYTIIKDQLNLIWTQFLVPTVNPRVEENQLLVNAVLTMIDVQIDPDNCKPLIYDLTYVEVDVFKKIIKDRGAEDRKADQLDVFRYLCNVLFPDINKLALIQKGSIVMQ